LRDPFRFPSPSVAAGRDRRRDQLLQENGYFVLRIAAEDLGKNLDLVFDVIPRTMSHRGKRAPAE
jgi:very-short-patch-repair endonuclease